MHRVFAVLLAIAPLTSLATPAGLTNIPLTKRSALRDENGVVDGRRLQNHVRYVESKLQNGFEAFEKNTGAPHPSHTNRLSKRAAPRPISLTDEDQNLWEGSISVGTPPQTFIVDFDTGTADMFLPASNCTVNCAGHTLFNPNTSSSAVALNKPFGFAYGDGSTVLGNQFNDTVHIAGLSATNQTFGVADQYSTGFALPSFPPDGLMGMAFPAISVLQSSPVVQSLVGQNKTSPEFSVKLSTNGSELLIGGTDPDLYEGPFQQNDVVFEGYWQINLTSVNANRKAALTDLSVIVDTGTTLVLGNAANVSAFYATIPGSKNATDTVGAGFYTVPCDSIPEVSLTFGDTEFPISAETFNYGKASDNSSDCVGGIAEAQLGAFWVVGDVFLQNVYTSFNIEKSQVGFARLA
ncbi:hypothetical protein PLICRDRAFT_170473 [Plicaturopsis crispa FD-325 SS-3]|nr:hypothetical protein PLICRDRAFT_170473 [Plicaturopsis crispa FD-325 SS-3]